MSDNGIPLSVTDVYRLLLDRLGASAYAPGAQLPSCRQLATELGSNASTVDRALKRLAEVGLVRTVPRRGTFVVQTGTETAPSRDEIADEVERVLQKAWRSGVALGDIRSIVTEALGRLEEAPKVAFVECNRRDLQHMQSLVREASGIDVQPVLLDDAWGRTLDEEFDVVATPIFHLNDLAPVVSSFDRVVEITFVASPTALRRLVAHRDAARLVVAAPTERGVAWMTAVVGQYYAGTIEGFVIGVDDPARLAGAEVVVTNNAAPLPVFGGRTAGGAEVVSIDWELDPRFSSSFRERVDEVIARRRVAPDAPPAPATRTGVDEVGAAGAGSAEAGSGSARSAEAGSAEVGSAEAGSADMERVYA